LTHGVRAIAVSVTAGNCDEDLHGVLGL
jgi:hypothetical protein